MSQRRSGHNRIAVPRGNDIYIDCCSFHHTDMSSVISKTPITRCDQPSSVFFTSVTAWQDTNMFVHFINRLKRSFTGKHICLDVAGCQSDLESTSLTGHPDSALPKRTPCSGELDLIVGVHTAGEVRKLHSTDCALSFPGDVSHLMWHARTKGVSARQETEPHQLTQLFHENLSLWGCCVSTTRDQASSTDLSPSLASTPSNFLCDVAVSLGMRPSLPNRLSSVKAFLCDTTASCGGRSSFTNWTSSFASSTCTVAVSVDRRPRPHRLIQLLRSRSL